MIPLCVYLDVGLFAGIYDGLCLGSRDYYLVVSHIISLAVITDNNIVQTLSIPLCVYLDVGLFAGTRDGLCLGPGIIILWSRISSHWC